MSPTKKLWVELIVFLIFMFLGLSILFSAVDRFVASNYTEWTNILVGIVGVVMFIVNEDKVKETWHKL